MATAIIRAGIIKRFGPNIIKQMIPLANPIIPGNLDLDWISCSIKITTNSAVMAKSIPVLLNGINVPIKAPRIEPIIHDN